MAQGGYKSTRSKKENEAEGAGSSDVAAADEIAALRKARDSTGDASASSSTAKGGYKAARAAKTGAASADAQDAEGETVTEAALSGSKEPATSSTARGSYGSQR